jgi:ribosomal protein S6
MAKKEAEMRNDAEMPDEGSGPRVYELGFHLDPELPAEEVKKAYQAIREVIESVGTIVADGDPEQVQLAYTISRQEPSGRRDFNTAYFSWIAYECDAAKHAEVAEAAKADRRVIRSLDILTTKEAARHAAEVRALSMKAPAKEGEENVSEAELDAALEEVAV